MTTIDVLRNVISGDPERFGLTGALCPEDVQIIARTPRVASATARLHFEVFVTTTSSAYKQTPTVIVQTPLLGASEAVTLRNPYCPVRTDLAKGLSDLLPTPHGTLYLDERPFYWARYVPWPSVRDLIKCRIDGSRDLLTLIEIADRLRKPPWSVPFSPIQSSSTNFLTGDSSSAPDLCNEYVTKAHAIAELSRILNPFKERLGEKIREGWNDLKIGFAHGDLWCQDILSLRPGQYCVLDWEWSTPAQPMGLDLFHLALSTIEISYRVSLDEALTHLIWGNKEIEVLFRESLTILWNDLGYRSAERTLSVIGYLVYIQHRIILQASRSLYPEGYLTSDVSLGLSEMLATALTSHSYLEPLVHCCVLGNLAVDGRS